MYACAKSKLVQTCQPTKTTAFQPQAMARTLAQIVRITIERVSRGEALDLSTLQQEYKYMSKRLNANCTCADDSLNFDHCVQCTYRVFVPIVYGDQTTLQSHLLIGARPDLAAVATATAAAATTGAEFRPRANESR